MADEFDFGGDIVWQPTDEHLENARLTEFMQLHGLKNFDELLSAFNKQLNNFIDISVPF